MAIYELTGAHRDVDGRVVHQIRATETLIERGITTGDLGGWIQKTSNVIDRGWVGEDAVVMDDAEVSGDSQVRHRARVEGTAKIRKSAVIYDDAVITEDALVDDDSTVGGDARVGAGCRLYVDTHLRAGTWPITSS
ncbi:hypothetical protein [Gordonia sihwensis]|uniref:hypothetical protein n=1 Tax=Gordonia sihwensis TaxID=173559 RepID=UPI003D96F6A3